MKVYPNLYTLDSKGKVRLWRAETDPEKGYKIVSGLVDGKQAETSFKAVTPKNVGKANETTVEQQIEIEVAALYEKRVKTDGYFYDVADVSKGKSYFSPMLAKKYSGWQKGWKSVVSKPKLDGFRCLVYEDRIHSREGEPFLTSPHVVEALEEAKAANPSIVFDGELYNHLLKNDFEQIQRLVAKKTPATPEQLAVTREKVEYHIYDIFDRNRPGLDALERVEVLGEIFAKFDFPSFIKLVDHEVCTSHDSVLKAYDRYLDLGYEGQMVLFGAYEVDKRSGGLLKHKPLFDEEFTIEECIEGTGDWAGALKAMKVSKGDIVSEVGVAGPREDNAERWNNRDKLRGTLVTVEYRGITKDQKLRFGVAKKFWNDTVRLF